MPRYVPVIKPGVFELYCGPMKSGKTRELLHRVDHLHYLKNGDGAFIFLKPNLDTRNPNIHTRFGKLSYPCTFVPAEKPERMLEYVSSYQLVAIDELQFFGSGIDSVVEELLRKELNVVGAGLDLDFRGEPFGQMDRLLAIADEVYKLVGVCEFEGCSAPATRTQRLVEGRPASYDSPIILVGDAEEGYQCRCFKHHEVPGKPSTL